MGGQQFGEASVLIDTRALDRVLAFDAERGLITVEGGIQWPAADSTTSKRAQRRTRAGSGASSEADRRRPLSLGGALACNAHGRGPGAQADRRASGVVRPARRRQARSAPARAARTRSCSGWRSAGTACSASSRACSCGCARASRCERVVDARRDERHHASASRSGSATGTSTATTSSRPTTRATASCAAACSPATGPSPPDTPLTENPTRFNPEDWARLTFYSHTNKRLAFEVYRSRYLATSGQIYWSDSQLSAAYVDNYHADLDRATGARVRGTEMITEIYVERRRLARVHGDGARDTARAPAQRDLRHGPPDRERRRDLPGVGARALRVRDLQPPRRSHAADIERAAETFRALIDLGIGHGGSYYLTYHRWARRDQVERCYPQMPEFLALQARSTTRARCSRATGIATTGPCSPASAGGRPYEPA